MPPKVSHHEETYPQMRATAQGDRLDPRDGEFPKLADTQKKTQLVSSSNT